GVALRTLACADVQLQRMRECSVFCGNGSGPVTLVEGCMADVAVVANHLAGGTEVLSIVTAEATKVVVVTHIIGMRLPVDFHLRENAGRENLLHLRDRHFYRGCF